MGLCSGTGARFGEAYSLFQARCEGREGRLEGGKKEKLLKVGLELRAIKIDGNDHNKGFWGALVNNKWKVIKGGIREVVRSGD